MATIAVDSYGPGVPAWVPRKGFVIVPSDDNELENVIRGILLDAAGTVKVVLVDDDDPVVLKLSGNVVHHLAVRKVLATGTDAALNLVGLY